MARSFLFCALIILSLITYIHSFALPAPLPLPSPQTEVEDPEEPEEPEEPEGPEDPDNDVPPTLIGDLLTGITTPMGQTIANILLRTETGQSSISSPPPAKGGVAGCKTSTDPCCLWYSVSTDLSAAFRGPTGRCNELARQAIRMGFHDAGTWSLNLSRKGQDYGGADGSLVLFNEISRKENRGLEPVLILTKALKLKYGKAIGMADLVQFMATHAVVTCPLGPRVRTFIGRKDATRAAPDGLLPSVSSDSNTLISLFEDKSISPHDLVALLGAHSTSRQFTTSPKLPNFGRPQDSTPGVWDVSFYNETIQPSPKAGTFRLTSDTAIAQDPRTSDEWNAFVGDQSHWNEDYARSYVRLSLLGVNVINGLTECTKVLPAAKTTFAGSPEGKIITEKREARAEKRDFINEAAKRGGCTYAG